MLAQMPVSLLIDVGQKIKIDAFAHQLPVLCPERWGSMRVEGHLTQTQSAGPQNDIIFDDLDYA